MKKKLTPDLIMITDGQGHHVADAFLSGKKQLASKLRDKIVVILDHDIPAGSFETAFIQKKLIDFAEKEGVEFQNAEGIGYVVLNNRLKPGNIFVSCGNHNAFVGAAGALGIGLSESEMEELLESGEIEIEMPETVTIGLTGSLPVHVNGWDFAMYLIQLQKKLPLKGKLIRFVDKSENGLSLDERQRICLAVYGCKAFSAVFKEFASTDCDIYLNEVDGMIAIPDDQDIVKCRSAIERTKVDACFIGGCAGGHISDLRKVAEILKGKRIKRELRLLIGFVDNETYLTAAHEGLIEIFFDAGAQVTNPGCGSCKTTSIGVVGDGEVLASTGCYNFAGCAGTAASKVYLVNAEAAAQAALDGYIGGRADGI